MGRLFKEDAGANSVIVDDQDLIFIDVALFQTFFDSGQMVYEDVGDDAFGAVFSFHFGVVGGSEEEDREQGADLDGDSDLVQF